MLIGKIIKSNSHTDYICQVYGHSEVEVTPTADDYAFGTFVRTAQEDDRWLVGIIYDTVLFNPEFGRLGPRLSPEAELSIFSPDYLNEKVEELNFWGKTLHYHRPLSYYFSILEQNSFRVTSLREPVPSGDLLKKHPDWKFHRRIPSFIVAKAMLCSNKSA